MNLSDFVNANGGWWSALALPLSLGALIAAVAQLALTVRTATMTATDRWFDFRRVVAQSEIPDLSYERELINSEFLPLVIKDQYGNLTTDPILKLTMLLNEKQSAEVNGPAGSGKRSGWIWKD